MASNLQVPNTISGTPQYIRDSSSNNSTLAISNSNVGIGTTSPAAALDVSGVIRGTGYSNPSSGSGTEIGYNSSGGYGYIQPYNRTSPAFLPMYIDSSTLYLNSNSSGNVGIGTTSPQYVLDVHYTGTNDSPAVNGIANTNADVGYGGNFTGGHIGVHGDASIQGGSGERTGGEFWAQNGVNNYGIKVFAYGSSNVNAVLNIAGYFYADREGNHGDFFCGYFEGPEKVYVGGNLGIGQTSPGSKLDIAGALTLEPTATPTPNPSSSNEARVYIKGGKFILQYNDAGTIRYKYLSLAGTGTTWSQTTTPP